jgi:hypothetical protein
VDIDVYNYHDPKGWEHTNPGWHQASAHVKHYNEILEWLRNNNSKFERHTRWIILDDGEMKFKFRYEKDYIMFTLRWS